MDIDINFDFTTDTLNYWKDSWENDSLLWHSNADPDSKSKTLQRYHQLLYSKSLPNGDTMKLVIGNKTNYLTWNNFRFGSDSIITSFRYVRNRELIQKVAESLPNYKKYYENYIHKSYTIGGEIIFPKMKGGINQSRGCNPFIKDRWDLTLECIRKYYNNETSPLYNVLSNNKDFFNLFVTFKEYVDFFYLQDCVNGDYTQVKFWLGNGEFKYYPLPQTVQEYFLWIENELDFVRKRNKRISDAIEKK